MVEEDEQVETEEFVAVACSGEDEENESDTNFDRDRELEEKELEIVKPRVNRTAKVLPLMPLSTLLPMTSPLAMAAQAWMRSAPRMVDGSSQAQPAAIPELHLRGH